jgi:hypothetical protein
MANFEQTIKAGKTTWGLGWSLGAGFLAFGTDLGLSYLLEQHSCSTGHHYVLQIISMVCFVLAMTGFGTGLSDFKRFPRSSKQEGGSSFDRGYFQALLGMALSLSFALAIIAISVPRWILSPCE